MSKEIKIGLIGAGWMGKAHTTAFHNARIHCLEDEEACQMVPTGRAMGLENHIRVYEYGFTPGYLHLPCAYRSKRGSMLYASNREPTSSILH